MGKEFVEYSNERGTIPYRPSILCFCLTEYAKDYIKEERKAISSVDTKVRDAVIVDSINYLGMIGCIDFALYTRDLYDDKRREEYVDPQCLLTALVNHYPKYIFGEGVPSSVLRNSHMNECTEKFSAIDGALVLVDFINYISKRNNFDRIFTLNELYEKSKRQNYTKEMEKLSSFLKLSSEYSKRLKNGETIDALFQELAISTHLGHISRRGTYYYDEYAKSLTGSKIMYSCDKTRLETELYAMAYAYAKMKGKKQTTKNQIIKKKIKEMSKKA